MRVKAIDIARSLGISKASVSLALNHKPGVSEETRKAVFECLARMQEEKATQQSHVGGRQNVKVLIFNNHLGFITDVELDLWTDVWHGLEKEARLYNYALSITYVDNSAEEIARVIEECNDEMIAGVIVAAVEMRPEELSFLHEIHHPIVIVDNAYSKDYHCVVIDNEGGIAEAMDYLVAQGHRNIVYLRQSEDIYNLNARRAGYLHAMERHHLNFKKSMMVTTGRTIQEIKAFMDTYLDSHELPDAFLMENYQVSIGTISALKKHGYRIPKDVSLIGVDEVPEYMRHGVNLTTVRVPHVPRAPITMLFLAREISERDEAKFMSCGRCELVIGDSVRAL